MELCTVIGRAAMLITIAERESGGLTSRFLGAFSLYPGEAKKYETAILYVQEVVTLQKKYLIYLLQKMRFTPFINYYKT